MAGVDKTFILKGAKVFYVATALEEFTEASVSAAAIDDNQVKQVSSIGDIGAERGITTFTHLDSDFETSFPGFASGGTFDMTVGWLPDDMGHAAFVDDKGNDERTIIIQKTIGEKVTYIVFNGTISNATISPPDLVSAVVMNISFARTGRHEVINKAG